MIRLTNLADYAVVLMVEMGRCQTRDMRANAQILAAASRLPVPTVSKILNTLARSDLLVSHRGHGGGFTLSRPAADITLMEIVEAIDGPIALTHCSEGHDNSCTLDSFCQVKPHWQHINDAVRGAMAAVSLADVMRSGQSLAKVG